MDVKSATLVQTMSEVQSLRWTCVAVYALTVYDWIILFHQESRLIHNGRWTPIKISYCFCRYYPLLSWPVTIWAWACDHDFQTCHQALLALQIILLPLQLSPLSVMVMRAYAFTGRQPLVLALLSTGCGAFSIFQIWGFVTESVLSPFMFVNLGRSGCFREAGGGVGDSGSTRRIGYVMIAQTVIVILATCLIIGHCIRIRGTQGSLGALLVKQGLVAFLIISLCNLLSGSFYLVRSWFNAGQGFCFALMVPNLIACRLILGLRARVSPTETQEMEEVSQVVRDALGAMGSVDCESTIVLEEP